MKTTTKTTNGTKAIRMTAEQVKNDSKREYNPQVWIDTVDSYSKYKNVEFYKVEKNDIFNYDKFFVVYTLEEGLRLLNQLSYGGSLTNGGFYKVFVTNFEVTYNENNEPSVKSLDNNEVYINIHKLTFSNGEIGALDNSLKSRKFMTEQSNKWNQIWSKQLYI